MNYRHYYCNPKPNGDGNGYYGTISGLKGMNMVEAASIDEFEEEFHRIVDEHIRESEEKKSRKTRRTIVWAIVLVALFVGLITTCPDKQKHADALKELTSSLLNDEVSTSGNDGWEYLGAMIGNKLIGAVVDNNLYVDNYVLFSIGKMSFDGEENTVSFGIFNHVFTKSREQFKKDAKENPDVSKAIDELFN